MRRARACFVGWLLVSASAPLMAQPAVRVVDARPSTDARARQLLERGHELYRTLDFPGCVDAMQRVLEVPGVSAAHRLEALETMGAANVVLDRTDAAVAAFEAMFALDPYHRVREPSGSPKIEEFVEALRARRVPDAALDPDVALRPELPGAARVGRELSLRVQLEGSRRLPHLEVFARSDEETEWRRLRLASEDGLRFDADLELPPTPGLLELYFEARDERGRVVARAGEPLLPLVVELRERLESDAVWRKAWFWTLIGAVVVGAVVGAVLGTRSRAPIENGSLPPFRVELP